jgi:hypothetical protein
MNAFTCSVFAIYDSLIGICYIVWHDFEVKPQQPISALKSPLSLPIANLDQGRLSSSVLVHAQPAPGLPESSLQSGRKSRSTVQELLNDFAPAADDSSVPFHGDIPWPVISAEMFRPPSLTFVLAGT